MTKNEALKLALEALEKAHHAMQVDPSQDQVEEAITAIKEALVQPEPWEKFCDSNCVWTDHHPDCKLSQPEQEQKCWCTTCRPITLSDMRFVVCPDCGNKRCPKANDHRNACTGSNEVGQKGSSWEQVKPVAQPEQEPVGWLDSNDKLAEFMHKDLKAEHDKRDSSTPRAFQIPVYTTPPQRKPLTDEEIAKEFYKFEAAGAWYQFARAIEAAHGIKG